MNDGRLGMTAGRGEIAIEFRDVSRRFVLHHERRSSFQDWFIGLIRPRGSAEEFWALHDINFNVQRGEAIGLLGRNGAGKSTLLKLVTRVLEPTGGQILIHGRVHALLELGAGFHPELSGRDNVFLNGSIYGFSRRQMLERYPAIVQFAELERFIDTPVKHYSSGMFMRLGFAIALHMEPDILVIDEVLAVGDAAFQRKSYAALQRLKAGGTTILFVSHNAEQVRGFCDRAALLQQGHLIDIGPADDVVNHYIRLLQDVVEEASLLRVRAINAAGMLAERIEPGADLGVEVLLRLRPGGTTANLALAIDLYDRNGVHLFGSTGDLPEDLPAPEGAPDLRRARGVIRDLPIGQGPIVIAVKLLGPTATGLETLDRQETTVDVEPGVARERGLLRLDHTWDWEPETLAGPATAVSSHPILWRGR